MKTEGIVYCVENCPTGFNNAPTCQLDTAVIVNINFESILMKYGPTVTFTQSFADLENNKLPSVYPSKYRGVWFDGNATNGTAFIKITGGTYWLNFNFSIYAWIYRVTFDQQHMIYSKQMANGTRVVQMFINDSNEMDVNLLNFSDNSTCGKAVASAVIDKEIWTYVAWSITVSGGTKINFKAYVDDASKGSQNDMCDTDAIVLDDSAYPTWIGTEFDGTDKYLKTMSGFIYHLAVAQTAYSSSYEFYSTSCSSNIGCSSRCLTAGLCMWKSDFDEYESGTSCDSSCDYTGCSGGSSCIT